MSRPEKEISISELHSLMSFYPTLEEVSAWFNCSPDTIERRIKDEWGMSFRELRNKRAGKTRLLLKRKAITKALEEDNEKMLLYCLRTMTDIDDRAKKSVDENQYGLNYTLEFLSEGDLHL
jgi:AraC-like DNA-binding protein